MRLLGPIIRKHSTFQNMNCRFASNLCKIMETSQLRAEFWLHCDVSWLQFWSSCWLTECFLFVFWTPIINTPEICIWGMKIVGFLCYIRKCFIFCVAMPHTFFFLNFRTPNFWGIYYTSSNNKHPTNQQPAKNWSQETSPSCQNPACDGYFSWFACTS